MEPVFNLLLVCLASFIEQRQRCLQGQGRDGAALHHTGSLPAKPLSMQSAAGPANPSPLPVSGVCVCVCVCVCLLRNRWSDSTGQLLPEAMQRERERVCVCVCVCKRECVCVCVCVCVGECVCV